jgi:GntR family transcriptional regulator
VYPHLDHHSGEPIYRQIVEQIKYKIATGELGDEDRLPSIRSLAEQLKINPRTVVRAYEELQHADLVVMQQGRGVFVSPSPEATPPRVRRRVIADMARRMLAEALRMGADRDEVISLIQEEADEMEWDQ